MKRSTNTLRADCTTAAAAVFRMMCVLCFTVLTAWGEELKAEPLIRGTLWWIIDEPGNAWTRERLVEAIDAQRAVGFDLLWVLNAPQMMKQALEAEALGKTHDVLRMLHEIADGHGMQVIIDLPKGGWYGKSSAEEMIAAITGFARQYHVRYGKHPSFHGWYLNHEINPIAPDDTKQTAFWRTVWHGTVKACHEVAPSSKVTISPFFLLDRERKRGFVYQTPEEYGAWWCATLRETGIDVLMLQDSGEHLSFFTLEDREPFWTAAAAACREAGAEFWLNVESGEADVKDWNEYLRLEGEGKVPWRVTPMPWLERKLCRAVRHATRIVNWGYYPFMDPLARPGRERADARSAYDAYKAWYDRVNAD